MPSSSSLEQTARGVKRKRRNEEDSEEAKLRRKLHHALRELRKVVKRARTFEIQKTLKKLKDARHKKEDSDGIKDLETQMEILKHLNYDQLATSALQTKFRKDKTLFVDPRLQTVMAELALQIISPGTPGTPIAKVQSRILSSKLVASEVVSTVEALRLFLYPTEGSGDTDRVHASRNAAKKKTGRRKKAVLSLEDDSLVASGATRDHEDDAMSGVEAVSELNDGWESGTIGALSESDDLEGTADDHDSSSVGSADQIAPPRQRSLPHGSKSHSEFLPSLSVGFTRGDSDSEFSDSESRFLDGQKKNRRGQRARRAIWERKYGKLANHVKKKQGGTERRQPGSVPTDRIDRRSAAMGSSSAQFRREPMRSRARHDQLHRRKPDGIIKGFKAQSQTKDDIRGKQAEPPLHPSWEAKRKNKSASIIPSQGTKIIFSHS